MKQKTRMILKRVLPLILAVAMVLGVFSGLLATVVGAADKDVNENVRPGYVELRDLYLVEDEGDRDAASNPKYGNSYYARLELRITQKGREAGIKVDGDNPNFKVTADNDYAYFESKNSKDDFKFYETTNAKDDRHVFYLGVRPHEGNRTFRAMVKYEDDSYDILSRNLTELPYSSSYDDDDDSGSGTRRTSTNSSDEDDKEVAEDTMTPKILITDYEAPDSVQYGEEFKVTIKFMNNSKKKAIENKSMTITPPEAVSIVNGTNKRHYITIPQRQSTTETFHFKASKDLKLESIPIAVKFDGQYKVDGKYSGVVASEETIYVSSIPKPEEEDEEKQGRISRFEILNITPPDSLFPNEDGYLTVKVINKDLVSDAANVQLTISGNALVNNGATEYHGALAHSSQAQIEIPVQIAQSGTFTCEAIVTYEDRDGKNEDGTDRVRINDVKKEFTVTVQEQPEEPSMDDFPPDVTVGGEMDGMQQGLSPLMIALIAVGGVIILIVVILVVRRVRKKKSGDDDEDI